MKPYPSIPTIFRRDPATNFKSVILGEWATPEFEHLQHNRWTFTEKVDGMNIRVMFDGEHIRFDGRANGVVIPKPLLDSLTWKFMNYETDLRMTFPHGVTLYGEGYGEGIQKTGKRYRKDQQFILFDVRIGDWWLKRDDVEGIADRFNIDVIPSIGEGSLWLAVEMVRKGFTSEIAHDNTLAAEGIVVRPSCELQTRGGKRIIGKIKHSDFR